MPTTTVNMGLTKPVLNLEPGVWDTYLNTSLDTLDLHDHVTGRGVPIPSAGILLDDDLTFGDYAATNLKAVGFVEQGGSYFTALSLYVNGSELYWRTAGGTNVQLTSGTGLNTASVGGITGDYAASGASFYYDDATETYLALQDEPLPNNWAGIAAGGVDIYEKVSGTANRVRLSSPASLAASYALTFPDAVPSSTSSLRVLTVNSTGKISFTNALQSPSAATTTSLLKGVDAGGNIRSVIDHNGYRMGRVCEWAEDWRTTGTTEPAGWTFTNSGGSETRAYTAPTSSLPFRSVVLTLPASSTQFAYVLGPGISYINADLSLVYETIIRTGAAVDSGTAMELAVGFRSDGDNVEFRFTPDANANVITSIGTNGSGAVVTSVAVAVSTTYQLRIEILGDNNHAGSNTLFRFFINGSLADERTSTAITGVLVPWFYLENQAGSSAYTASCGPIRCCWNQVAAPADL